MWIDLSSQLLQLYRKSYRIFDYLWDKFMTIMSKNISTFHLSDRWKHFFFEQPFFFRKTQEMSFVNFDVKKMEDKLKSIA